MKPLFDLYQKMIYLPKMEWRVVVSGRMAKVMERLPKVISDRLATLMADIEKSGPVRGNWKNYSKLGPDKHHCHLKSGRPTYVACWQVQDKN